MSVCLSACLPASLLLRAARVTGCQGGGGSGDPPPEVVRLREQLIQNFQERMQLQRSVIELQSQNVQNTAEVNRR